MSTREKRAMKRYSDLFSPKFRMTVLILVVVLLLVVAVSRAVPLAQTARELEQKPPAQLLLTPTAISTITGVFATLLPGAQLPSEAECAVRVHRSSWEPRPDNHAANHRVPTAQQIVGLVTWGPDNGQDAQADTPGRQITGNFTGTTDEILQWVSCKWGIDVNIVRAQAIAESD